MPIAITNKASNLTTGILWQYGSIQLLTGQSYTAGNYYILTIYAPFFPIVSYTPHFYVGNQSFAFNLIDSVPGKFYVYGYACPSNQTNATLWSQSTNDSVRIWYNLDEVSGAAASNIVLQVAKTTSAGANPEVSLNPVQSGNVVYMIGGSS